MRGAVILPLAALALAACASPPPISNPVVPDPFGRDRLLEGGIPPAPTAIVPPVAPFPATANDPFAAASPATDPAGIAAETRAALGLPPLVGAGSTLPDPSLDRDNAGISAEQDFGAVAGARSIEDDAERLRRARERFEVVAPPADLSRPQDAAPDVVGYALRQARPVGTDAFSRGLLATEGRAARRCAQFLNADAAQEAFLAAGGPDRDPRNLDPDGDGNACGWDPATYRGLLGRQGG